MRGEQVMIAFGGDETECRQCSHVFDAYTKSMAPGELQIGADVDVLGSDYRWYPGCVLRTVASPTSGRLLQVVVTRTDCPHDAAAVVNVGGNDGTFHHAIARRGTYVGTGCCSAKHYSTGGVQ